MVAQKWADNCMRSHDHNMNRAIPGRFSVGQNVAWGYWSWNDVLSAWHGEVQHFTFGYSSGYAVVGNYTQMVWATTHLIGCGFSNCYFGKHYVCNYAPAGNVHPIYKPYIQAASCSMCSGRCVDGHLCDCSTTCLNGATVDVASCNCTCKLAGSNSPYLPPDCRLNCQGIDHIYCYHPYSTCPADNDLCPTKCNECPWADPTYVDPDQGTTESGTDISTRPQDKLTTWSKTSMTIDPDEGTTESVTDISTWPQDKSTTGSKTSMTIATQEAVFLLLLITTSVPQLLIA